MARWLASLGLCCGLAVVGTGSYALGQDSSHRAEATKVDLSESKPANGDHNRDGHQRGGRAHDDHGSSNNRDDNRQKDNRRSDGRQGDGRQGGPPRDQWREWRRIAEALRKQGGILELMPLLHVREVREDLGLEDAVFKTKLAAYMGDMQQRLESVRGQGQPKPDADWAKLFEEPLAKENAHFQSFFNDELSDSQQSRLIGLFIQARGYRSVSNQLIATKIGIDADDAARLRSDVYVIRETVMRESAPLFRRAFEKGADHEKFEELVLQSHKKMDARIEKLLTSEQREKLTRLRGKEVDGQPKWLLRGVEMPRLPMQPRVKSPPPKSDCDNARTNCWPKALKHLITCTCRTYAAV